MKPNTLALIAAILTTNIVPSASFAAQESESKGVTVMSRGEADPTKLQTKTYTYVAYKSEGIEGAAWGRIVQIDPDGIVIEPESTPTETRKITFGDIDILAVAEDRVTFKSWLNARLAAEKITVMSREDLDLTKLATGSYAHVVYTWRGLKRTASGKVLETDPNGIVVKSGAEQPETGKIAAADIDTLAFSKTSQALEGWQRWAESGIVRMSRWDLNSSMLKEGLYVHVVYVSGGEKRKATGRIVDRYTHRFVIQTWVGGKATWAQPEKLEIAYGDIETVIAARDQRDMQRAKTYVEFASGRDAASGERIAAKLIFGVAFGLFTGTFAALSHYPDVFLEDYEGGHSPLKSVIPSAILHAATTSWVVNKADPGGRYRHAFVGGLLGCATVATVTRLSRPEGYEGFGIVALGYLTVPVIAATIASEISRDAPDAPGFTIGLTPRRNGSVTAVATYRF